MANITEVKEESESNKSVVEMMDAMCCAAQKIDALSVVFINEIPDGLTFDAEQQTGMWRILSDIADELRTFVE